MAAINITCPGCRKAYVLKTQNPGAMMGKEFRCPKCGFSVPFSMLMGNRGMDNPALHTHIADGRFVPPTHIAGGGFSQNQGYAFGGQKTKVAQQVQMGAASRMSLVVESTGMSFPLMPGVYILGRASSDSRATLKLAPDPYMSRQHARLVYNPMTTGIGTEFQLCGLSSINPIFVNGKKISTGQSIILHPGDKILLGKTTVVLKR